MEKDENKPFLPEKIREQFIEYIKKNEVKDKVLNPYLIDSKLFEMISEQRNIAACAALLEFIKALDERINEIAEEDFFEASLLARSFGTVKAVVEEEMKKYESN